MSKTIEGEVDGIKYSIDESIVKRLKDLHNVDALKEIEEALRKQKDENKSITE